MALLTHRDPLVVGAALAGWFATRTGAHDVRVVNAEHPSIGYSSETVLVDLTWTSDGGRASTHELVVRLAPPTVGDVPRLRPRAADGRAARRGRRRRRRSRRRNSSPTSAWLGAPFVVMPRVRGNIIGEVALLDPWLHSLDEAAARAGARGIRRRGRRRRTAPTSRPRPAFPNATTRPSSTSGPTTSTGRAAARRFPRSSTRSSGVAPTDPRRSPNPSCSGATFGSAT